MNNMLFIYSCSDNAKLLISADIALQAIDRNLIDKFWVGH